MSVPRRTRPPRGGAGRLRRDPRTERDIPERKQPDETAIPRLRRDPRALRAIGRFGPGQRLRIDRTRSLAVVDTDRAMPLPATTASGPRPVVIEDPACWILAVPDMENGCLSRHDRDALAGARRLADSLEGAVIVLHFGTSEDLGRAGADRVLEFEHPEFQGYAPEARAAAVMAVIETWQPRHVVLPDSVTGGGDLGRRVAGKLGELPAAHVQRIDVREIVTRGNGGRSDYLRTPPRLLLVDAGAADPVTDTLHEGRRMDTPQPRIAPHIVPRIMNGGPIPVEANTVPLAEAEFIAAAGAGVADWGTFHALVRAMGAAEGGSRVVCDAGCLPRTRQIGASGTLVAPRCYLALGISGAPQHLQGITGAEKVIAVNTNPYAEMMKRADLAVVADVQKVMAALLLRLEGEQGDV